MTGSEEKGREIRKIAVAFDPVCGVPGLLETAAEFAALFGAELEALFVDDPDMTRLSQLPFGRTIELTSGKAERFDALALAQGRAGPAARIRATLRSLAQLHRFAYTVRELHGRALMEATGESTAELLVVASFHGKFGGTRHVRQSLSGRTVRGRPERSLSTASRRPHVFGQSKGTGKESENSQTTSLVRPRGNQDGTY